MAIEEEERLRGGNGEDGGRRKGRRQELFCAGARGKKPTLLGIDP
jgi:hypothetical protein